LLEEGGIELPVCESCGGVWLNKGRSERITEGELSAKEKRLARLASRHSRGRRPQSGYRSAPRTEESERACPECRSRMAPLRIRALELVVDGCRRHGSWFDAGELRVVVRWFELLADGLDENTARLVLLLRRAKKTRKKRDQG
jgi:Zn-finger nucleic acid-binding protein